jgi:CP family cyanate transporter-like MFS transporter
MAGSSEVPGSSEVAGSTGLRAPLAVLAALFLIGLIVRPSLIAVGPLLPAIQGDLEMSFRDAGLLGTLPILCLGLFAPFGPRLAARLGPRNAMAACIAITVVFSLLRAVAPSAWLVIALSLGIGLGMGMAGSTLPIIVRLRAPAAPGLATGVYAFGIVVSGSASAGLAVPLAGPELDWRRSLLIIGLACAPPLVGWLRLLAPDKGHERITTGPRSLPWRHPVAWGLVAAFGLQALLYFAAVTWLPSLYVERGWSPEAAGSVVSLLNFVGIGGTVLAPLVADRYGTRRSQLLATSIAVLAGCLGVALVPDAAYLWAVVLGVSLGAIFPLALILPVDVADRPGEIGAAAALMLLGGYCVAAVGPVLLGMARDATGDFAASMWLLVALAVAQVGSAWVLSPDRLRRGIRPLAGTG